MIIGFQHGIKDKEKYKLNQPGCTITILCTLDGVTYATVCTDKQLPTQLIDLGAQEIELTSALRKRLSEASPQVQLIRHQVRSKIAERYALHDEIKLLRTGDSNALAAYNQYVEACRAWGRTKKAEFGL